MSGQAKKKTFRSGKKLIFTAGRPPWFNAEGQTAEDAFVIGVTGGTASGKTTVARKIIESLDVPWVCILSMDSFYKFFRGGSAQASGVLNEEELKLAHDNNFNFDAPTAFDIELMTETLRKLKGGQQVEVPIYDFATHARKQETIKMYGASVILVEGILAFATPGLRELMDLKIFTDEDADIRLARRIRRDIAERGRELQGALKQYNKFVKPAFDQFIKPTMEFADLVVPRGASNTVAMTLILQHIHAKLKAKGTQTRKHLVKQSLTDRAMPDNLTVMEPTNQSRVLQTIIRDQTTSRDDFVFYSNRLQRLLIELAISLLPHDKCTVETTAGESYEGRRFNGQLCGISIIRAGLTMDDSLRAVVQDIPLGKILIQTNDETKEPELYYTKLPLNIKDSHVLLLDATVATGAAAMMAIRVLLDHGVLEENIYFVSLISAPMGVHSVAYAFPKVKIITSAVDREINDEYHILPGIGNFGDRYFGT